MKKILFFSFIFVLNNSNAESLFEIYKLAQKNDGDYLVSVEKYRATIEKKPQTLANLYPNISADVSRTNNETDSTKTNTTSKSIKFNQLIYNKAMISGVEQANLIVKNAELVLKQAKETLIMNVANAYFGVLIANDNLKNYQEEAESIKSQLKDIRQKFKVGITTSIDLSVAVARKNLADSKVLSAESSFFIAKRQLGKIINNYNINITKLNLDIPLQKPRKNVEEWVKIAFKNSNFIKIKQILSELARTNLEIQRAGHYPSLNLSASLGDLDSDSPVMNGKNNSISLKLTIPIFSGGLTNSKVREAQYNFNGAKENLISARFQTENKIKQIYFTTISHIEQIKATQKLLKSSKEALNAVKEGFNAGTRTTTDVLNSRSQVVQSQLNLNKLKYNFLIEQLSLKKEAGVLSVNDLQRISQLLQK